MSRNFEEIDFQDTDIGEVILQRRRFQELGDLDVFEVKLNEEYLMSSIFTVGEVALSEMGLDALDMKDGSAKVVVGGLGLGYTAEAALAHPVTGDLLVVEFLSPVIDWHQRHLVPIKGSVADHPHCRLSQGDFFGRALNPDVGLDPENPGTRYDAILLDVDHSPSRHLRGFRGGFYQIEGLKKLAQNLRPGGIFALWSDDLADPEFMQDLEAVFDEVWNEPVFFPNPMDGGEESNSVYIARTAK
ncbi:MAG: spermidine synthase [Spirochaetales bacterium]|nr:spermidine synthase [Spirochaetales bacterium]